MDVMDYLWFLALISAVGAAKSAGDDDWVHLPNKCEGKCSRKRDIFHCLQVKYILRLTSDLRILI